MRASYLPIANIIRICFRASWASVSSGQFLYHVMSKNHLNHSLLPDHHHHHPSRHHLVKFTCRVVSLSWCHRASQHRTFSYDRPPVPCVSIYLAFMITCAYSLKRLKRKMSVDSPQSSSGCHLLASPIPPVFRAFSLFPWTQKKSSTFTFYLVQFPTFLRWNISILPPHLAQDWPQTEPRSQSPAPRTDPCHRSPPWKMQDMSQMWRIFVSLL